MNGVVYSLRFLLNFSLALTLAFAPVVRADQKLESAQGELKALSAEQSAINVQFEVKEVEPEQAEEELASQLANANAETVIVSSDEIPVLEQTATSKPGALLIPYGKAIRRAAELPGGINQLLRKSGAYIGQAFKKDKIGFGLATFNVSNEVVRWIHVSTASDFVITSNIIYSIVWAGLFVDKDTWSKTTKPIQKTYRKLFGLGDAIPSHPTAQDTAIKFLSGLTLSMILNTGRAAIVGIDQLAHQVFDPLNLSMPFVMGAVMTAVGFSWSELIGSIDENQFPRTKKIMRFVMNSRSCLISYFAASAMLMNPEHYGIMPWIVVSISGTTGLALYSTAKKWLPWVEGPRCESLFTLPQGA